KNHPTYFLQGYIKSHPQGPVHAPHRSTPPISRTILPALTRALKKRDANQIANSNRRNAEAQSSIAACYGSAHRLEHNEEACPISNDSDTARSSKRLACPRPDKSTYARR